MTHLLVEVGPFRFFYSTPAQAKGWLKRNGYTRLGPSESHPDVELWTASGKALVRIRELPMLTSIETQD